MAVAYLLGNGSAPLLVGALEDPFVSNASAAACRPSVPPCAAAPPGSWGNGSVAAGWNRSEPCGGANGSAGGGGPCAPTGGGPSVVTAIAIMALYSVVCVVGLFGNFLVMYVIVRWVPPRPARRRRRGGGRGSRWGGGGEGSGKGLWGRGQGGRKTGRRKLATGRRGWAPRCEEMRCDPAVLRPRCSLPGQG